MKFVFFAIAAMLASSGNVLAMDSASQAVAERYKAQKLVRIDDIAILMRGSERWCYREDQAGCDWSDVYLDVGATTAEYEISNAWSDATDIAFTDHGEFRDGRYICETGYDWTASIRATRRDDGIAIGGRELAAIKAEVSFSNSGEEQNCFDYLFLSADMAAETVTLLQRQYDPDGVTDAANDVEVTLHFNAAEAAALKLKW